MANPTDRNAKETFAGATKHRPAPRALAALAILGGMLGALVGVPAGKAADLAAGRTSFPSPGEWPSDRRDGTRQARSPLRARIHDPKIRWRHYTGAIGTLLALEPGDADQQKDQEREIRVPAPEVLDRQPAQALLRWEPPRPTALVAGQQQIPAQDDNVTYADVLPDAPGLEKLEFENSFSIPVVAGAWQKARGRGSRWRGDRWEAFWETPPMDALFGACPMVGDYDRDGTPELMIRPWYELVILDPRTGKVKDRCRFTQGRSYGLYGAHDLDGDGKMEFVVLADFAKHVDVLGYRQGKLSLLWKKDVELDISDPQKILRVQVDSVGDVDRDGHKEIAVNLYNDSGDRRWHLIVFDGMTGTVKADLPDECFQGMADLDGGGTAAILTASARDVGVPGCGTIRVRTLEGGRPVTLWQRDRAGWQLARRPTPPNVSGAATLGNEGVLLRRVGGRTLTVVRSQSPASAEETILSVLQWKDGGFHEVSRAAGVGISGVALDDQGALLVRCLTAPGASRPIRVRSKACRLLFSHKEGVSCGPVLLARRGDRRVLIAGGHGEELVTFAPPAPGEEHPKELWRVRGRTQSVNWGAQQSGAAVADLFGDGRRQVLYAAAAPSGCGRLVAADLDGRCAWHRDFPWIPGTPPIWNTGGVILWQAGRFTDPKALDVLVQVRRSMMHSEETILLSGRDGSPLWHRTRQVDRRGVGGAPHAIADFDGDGLDDVAQLHPSEFYLMKGSTGKDLLAMPASWPPVPAKPVYWGVPIAGEFERAGTSSVLFTGRSMTALVRAGGELVWWDALDKGASTHAIGDFDGDGKLEALGIGYEDGVRCYDAATGGVEWRMPSPPGGAAEGLLAGDVNSDGRDEAVLTIGSTLLAISAPEHGAQGRILWQLRLPARIGPPAFVDLGQPTGVAILVQGDDGHVYGVR